MPCRPSASTSSTRLPLAARASARAPATVVFPVPPLPVTMCSRTSRKGCCTEATPGAPAGTSARPCGARLLPVTTATYPGEPRAPAPACALPHRILDPVRFGHAEVGVRDRAAAVPRDEADPRQLG